MRILQVASGWGPSGCGATPSRGARPSELGVLAAVLLVLGVLQALHRHPPDCYGADGSIYFEVARHVAEGDGLVTNVSLYNQGLKEMPRPTTVYPLWPLLLGLVGRVVGLDTAARALPKLLYLIDLGLLYALTGRLVRAWGGPARIVGTLPIGLGHVVVVLFGLNLVFFRYSALPYTDPLALGLAFAALLALPAADARRPLARAALSGALAGAAYLSRTPMVAVPLGILAAMAMNERRGAGWRRPLLFASGACVLVVLPWIAWLPSFLHEFRPMMLIDVFTLRRETPELAPVRYLAPPTSLAGFVRQGLEGLRVAFGIGGPSYFASFGPVTYVVPLALVALALSSRLRTTLLRSSDASAIVATGLCGLGLAVLAQGAHSDADFARRWSFSHRYGLPYVLLVIDALACLVGATAVWIDERAPGWRVARGLRTVAIVAVAGSLVLAGWRAPRLYGRPLRPVAQTERDLAAWLDAHAERPVVIARRATRLAVISRSSFHWIGCGDDAEQTRRLFRHTGADLLVARRSDWRCRFLDGLRGELETVTTFRGDGPPLEVLRWRGAAALAPPVPLSGATS